MSTRLTWIYCPGHARVRSNEVADHVARNVIARDAVPVYKTDILKSVAEELEQEEEREC